MHTRTPTPLHISVLPIKHSTDTSKPIKPKKKRPKPILSFEEFVSQHRGRKNDLENYQNRNYRNKVELPNAVKDEISKRSEVALYANNMESRIRFTSIKHSVMAPFLLAETRPIYWITLTPGQYAFHFEQARKFDVSTLQAWAREILRGVSFVGAVDVGCYPIPGGTHSSVVASFHVHLIAWGADPAYMDTISKKANSRWQSFIPKRPVFHYKRTSPDQAIKRIFYMDKAPTKASRFVPKLVRVSKFTGEIFELGEDRHYEQVSRTGQFARMCLIMQGRTLDELSFAGGEGTPLLQTIRKRALAPLVSYFDKLDRQFRKGAYRARPKN